MKKIIIRWICAMFALVLGLSMSNVSLAAGKSGSFGMSNEATYENVVLTPANGEGYVEGETISFKCSGKFDIAPLLKPLAFLTKPALPDALRFTRVWIDLYRVNNGNEAFLQTVYNKNIGAKTSYKLSGKGTLPALDAGTYVLTLKVTYDELDREIVRTTFSVNKRAHGGGGQKLPPHTYQPSPTISSVLPPVCIPEPTPSREQRLPPVPEHDVWSEWSEWSTEPIQETENCWVQTKTEEYPVYGTQYRYNRWKYWNTAYEKWYYSYAEYRGSSYLEDSGCWEENDSTDPLPQTKVIDGNQQYQGYWYNESVIQTQTGSICVTLYRYCTRGY